MLASPTFLGSSGTVFLCWVPIKATGPVDEAITPTFTCACAAKPNDAMAAPIKTVLNMTFSCLVLSSSDYVARNFC
jgi:hypothetical protein